MNNHILSCLNQAISYAQKSDMNNQLGAVLYSGPKFLYGACNKNIRVKQNPYFGKSDHAELNVLRHYYSSLFKTFPYLSKKRFKCGKVA